MPGPPNGQQVKKPGDANWVDVNRQNPGSSPKAVEGDVTEVHCPDGTGHPLLINPR